jgi:hypothetical protein
MPLPEPTFDGVPLGYGVKMRTAARPVSRQMNAYPGVNGLEVLTMGSRGGSTIAEGTLYGADLTVLNTLLNTFINYQRDGGAYTLIDSKGANWPLVILEQFEPVSMVFPSWDGGVAQMYQAQFLHIL